MRDRNSPHGRIPPAVRRRAEKAGARGEPDWYAGRLLPGTVKERYVPLSVRYGSRRTRLSWWLKVKVREPIAFWLCPWLRVQSLHNPTRIERD